MKKFKNIFQRWLIFNAGSARSVVGVKGLQSSQSIVNSILASASSALTTLITNPYIKRNIIKIDYLTICNGTLCGLVAITASCDVIENWAAIFLGFLSSIVYQYGCILLEKCQIDDPLQVSQIHGSCGILGVISVAIFWKDKGILYGGPDSVAILGQQLLGCAFIITWVGFTSFLFFKISHKFNMLRTPPETEILGADIYYFTPYQFVGNINQYSLNKVVQFKQLNKQHKLLSQREIQITQQQVNRQNNFSQQLP